MGKVMRSHLSKAKLLFAAGSLGVLVTVQAAYPERTVTAVVGYPPGGVNDILARLIADPLG